MTLEQQKMVQKETMNFMLDLTKKCFGECVVQFKSPELTSNEEMCLQNCAKRFTMMKAAGSQAIFKLMQEQQGKAPQF